MTIWAISDIHLAFARPEARERHAERWRDHAAKLAANWRATVGPRDLVLIPGDVSGARNQREVQPDLAWLHALPGRKVLAPGNHDRWWNRVDVVRRILRRSEFAVDGDAIELDGVVLCGARAVPAPEEEEPGVDAAAVRTALERLDRALEAAAALRVPGAPLYVLWHYPPFDRFAQPGPWVERFEAAGVTGCVYGHLHAQAQWQRAVQGSVNGVRYWCVAADALGFRPLRIGAGAVIRSGPP